MTVPACVGVGDSLHAIFPLFAVVSDRVHDTDRTAFTEEIFKLILALQEVLNALGEFPIGK